MTSVLVSAPFLPVPGLAPDNDVVFTFFDRLVERHPEYRPHFVRPQIWVPEILGRFSAKWATYARISAAGTYRWGTHDVAILNYVTKRTLPAADALLSRSLYGANRRRLHALVRDHDIKLLHPQLIFPDGLMAYELSRRTGIPYVLTARLEAAALRDPVARRVALTVAGAAAAVTTMNGETHGLLRSLGVGAHLIPHGVDLAVFAGSARPAGLGSPLRLLTVARLLPMKRIDRVLEALASLRDCPFHYTIVGDGPEAARLRSMATNLGLEQHVTFSGSVANDEVARLMQGAHLFVLASEYEVFGRVFVESLAAGLPIVYPKGLGFDAFAGGAGVGTALRDGSPAEIAAAVRAYARDPARLARESQAARELAPQFTWAVVVERYHALYQQALSTAPGRRAGDR
jgi:glycosyltransferase involved in cell wall biosynthesis